MRNKKPAPAERQHDTHVNAWLAHNSKVLAELTHCREWGDRPSRIPGHSPALDPTGVIKAALSVEAVAEAAPRIAAQARKETSNKGVQASLEKRDPPRTDWQDPALNMAREIQDDHPDYFINGLRTAILAGWPEKVKGIAPPAERALDDFLSDCFEDGRLKPRAKAPKTKP